MHNLFLNFKKIYQRVGTLHPDLKVLFFDSKHDAKTIFQKKIEWHSGVMAKTEKKLQSAYSVS